jgi:pyruvate dehydrogenase E1 component alpha subunit
LTSRSDRLKTSSKLFQILKPDGSLTSETEPSLSEEQLLSSYRNMALTRILDEKLVGLQRQGRIGTYVSCAGQEAAQVGSAFALSEMDWVFPMYRDLGIIVEMGVPLDTLLNRIFANGEDLSLGRDLPNVFGWKKYRVFSLAAPIASHLQPAVGFAMAAKYRKDNIVTLASFGDGATSSIEFHVSLNFAGVFKAPTVFLCENNQYAISVPVSRQTASDSIAVKASAYGFDGVRVDGNDILGVYSAASNAIQKARSGNGPTLIECVTYRMASHSTSDDWKKYRSSEEVEAWRARDPISRFRVYLEERSLMSSNDDLALRKELDATVNEAIVRAESVPPLNPKTMLDDVFSDSSQEMA